MCICLTRLTLELDFDVCNLCRFFPEKAAALARDLLKELVEVIQFNSLNQYIEKGKASFLMVSTEHKLDFDSVIWLKCCKRC